MPGLRLIIRALKAMNTIMCRTMAPEVLSASPGLPSLDLPICDRDRGLGSLFSAAGGYRRCSGCGIGCRYRRWNIGLVDLVPESPVTAGFVQIDDFHESVVHNSSLDSRDGDVS